MIKFIASIAAALGSLVPACAPESVALPTQSHRAEVNALPYNLGDPAPAMTAFALVAEDTGMTPEWIAAWSPFAQGVMKGESGFCYNVRRGAVMAADGTCRIVRQGRGSDSGFGQVIRRYFYGPGQFLCVNHGICSADQITSEPYVSMQSLVYSIQEKGSQPWCYTKKLRSQTRCRVAPDR